MAIARTLVCLALLDAGSAFTVPSVHAAQFVRRASSTVHMGMFDFLAFGKAGASHILVSDMNRARYVKGEIEKGRFTFAAAAKEFSTCPSAAKGGDLGTFGEGAMVGPFNDYCFGACRSRSFDSDAWLRHALTLCVTAARSVCHGVSSLASARRPRHQSRRARPRQDLLRSARDQAHKEALRAWG